MNPTSTVTPARRHLSLEPVVHRPKYLFIRILEACNADCFMCEFALSRDTFRYSVEAFRALVPQAWAHGVRVIRFTGGEPLMHPDVAELVAIGAEAGMKMSLITNALQLPRRIDELAEAGLAQVIVSLDGSSAATHDVYRRSPGAFERGIAGLRRATELGIVPRVNSVVGPHNYDQMPELQRIITPIGVQQWELSAIKLDRDIWYPEPDRVRAVCEPIYDGSNGLVPLGKRFYGDTPAEQEDFFERALPPRAAEPLCHVTDDVIYIDGKRGRAFSCSCLPHKDEEESGGGAAVDEPQGPVLDSAQLREHRGHFRTAGPSMCTGCSSTAAGYSDDVARLGTVPLWRY